MARTLRGWERSDGAFLWPDIHIFSPAKLPFLHYGVFFRVPNSSFPARGDG